MPCVLKTWSRASVPYVLRCQPALRAHVPRRCQPALRVYVLTCLACSRANVPCVLTCSRALCTDVSVPTCFALLSCSRASVHWVLTCLSCQYALRGYVLTSQHCVWAHTLTCQHVLSPLPHMACLTTLSPVNMILISTFSIPLPLLKLYTLLLRFKSLTNLFP